MSDQNDAQGPDPSGRKCSRPPVNASGMHKKIPPIIRYSAERTYKPLHQHTSPAFQLLLFIPVGVEPHTYTQKCMHTRQSMRLEIYWHCFSFWVHCPSDRWSCKNCFWETLVGYDCIVKCLPYVSFSRRTLFFYHSHPARQKLNAQ